MKRYGYNIGKVVAKQAQVLIQWLEKHSFEYDELWFGKPYAHIYIDDKAFRFDGCWDKIDEELISHYAS